MVQLLQLASSLHVPAVQHRQITSLALFVASRFNPRPLKTQKRKHLLEREKDHLSPKACLHLTYSIFKIKILVYSTENHPLISNCFKNLLSWTRHCFMLVAIFNTVCTRTKHWFDMDQRSTNTYQPYKMISPNCSASCSSIPVCVDIWMHTCGSKEGL